MFDSVRVAVVAADLPNFEPPIDANGFDRPYRDRLAVTLAVEPGDTLQSVYRRAVEELRPRPVDFADDPLSVVRWTWFYEPADELGIADTKAWEVAEDLIVVDADGTARWNRPASEITLDQLDRAHQRGLLHGDPARPYLVLVLPQGGEALQTAWDAIVLIWQIASQLLTARELIKLARGLRRGEVRRDLEAGAAVVQRHRDRWTDAGGGPSQILRTLERRPWPLSDLRMLLGLDTDQEAADLLRALGFRPDERGDYVLSEDDESRILHLLGQEGGLGGFDVTDRSDWTQQRITTLLQTGELPSRLHPDELR
jgi:hypothetical protein